MHTTLVQLEAPLWQRDTSSETFQQAIQESTQDWEVKVRRYGSLCEYTTLQDKFVQTSYI